MVETVDWTRPEGPGLVWLGQCPSRFLNGILLATEENQRCNRPCCLALFSFAAAATQYNAASPLALIPRLLHSSHSSCTCTCRSSAPLVPCQRAILPHPPPPPTPSTPSLHPAAPAPPSYDRCRTVHQHIYLPANTRTRTRTGSFRPHLYLIMEIQSPHLPSYQLSNSIPWGAAHSRSSSTRRDNEKHQAEASAVQPFSA